MRTGLRLLHREIRRVAGGRLFSQAAASEEEKAWNSPSFVVQNKDLLRRSGNGLQILDLMDSGAVVPDLDIYSDLIRLYANSRRLDYARLVHAHFLRSNLPADVFLGNSIVNMFCKCGAMDDARQVFDAMLLRDMVTWTALITGYAQNGLPEETLALFPRMLSAGLRPNHFTFSSVLKASPWRRENFTKGSDPRLLRQIRLRLERVRRERNPGHVRAIREHGGGAPGLRFPAIKKRGLLECSDRRFRAEGKLGGCPRNLHPEACARIGSLEQGKWIHAHLAKSGCKITPFLGNTLLDMYAKADAMDEAQRVFHRLKNKDLISWNTILAACAQIGLGREAIMHFIPMWD